MSSAIGINNTWTAHLYPREEQWRNGRCTIKCRCAVVATYSFLREPTPPLSPLCVCVSLSGERRIHAGRVPLPPPYYCALLLLLYEGGAGARRRPVVTQSVDAKQECVACFLSHLVRHVKSSSSVYFRLRFRRMRLAIVVQQGRLDLLLLSSPSIFNWVQTTRLIVGRPSNPSRPLHLNMNI